MALPVDEQTQLRNQRAFQRLTRLNITPPEEVEQRRQQDQLNRDNLRNRVNFNADLQNQTRQEIQSAFYNRQSAHITGNMATTTTTTTLPSQTRSLFESQYDSVSQTGGRRSRHQSLIDIDEEEDPAGDIALPTSPLGSPGSPPASARRSRHSSHNPFINRGNGGGNGGGGGGPPNPPPHQNPFDADDPASFFAALSRAIGQGVGNALNQPDASRGDKSRSRIRDPDTFDGKDPEKLRTFLFQGILNFRDRPAAFAQDYQKVNYMISYLTGDALGWFEPSFVNPDPNNVPLWLNNYDAFVTELQLNFGTFDPRQDAENEIVALRMGDGQQIQKYLVRFNKLSQLTNWNSVALRKVFYDGLPERIQIKLRDLPGGKPTSLDVLKISAQSIDASHWEWQKEQKLRHSRNPNPKTGTTDNKSGNQDNNKTGNSFTPNTTGESKKKKGGGGNGGNSGRSPAQTLTSSEKPWAKMLGSDGKLLPAEKARRIAENLCLLCGEKGHRSDACPKKKSASGRAASTSAAATAPPDATSQSGK
jgi:hypothetical protein